MCVDNKTCPCAAYCIYEKNDRVIHNEGFVCSQVSEVYHKESAHLLWKVRYNKGWMSYGGVNT